MTEINYNEVPSDWAVCLQDNCPRGGECLRRKMGAMVPEGTRTRQCVMPTCRRGGDCPMFAPSEPVTVAWGMTGLFRGVSRRDEYDLRQDLIALFGDARRYYRFRAGRWPLSPHMQEAVARTMAKHGYTQPPHFDRTERRVFLGNGTDYLFRPGEEPLAARRIDL